MKIETRLIILMPLCSYLFTNLLKSYICSFSQLFIIFYIGMFLGVVISYYLEWVIRKKKGIKMANMLERSAAAVADEKSDIARMDRAIVGVGAGGVGGASAGLSGGPAGIAAGGALGAVGGAMWGYYWPEIKDFFKDKSDKVDLIIKNRNK